MNDRRTIVALAISIAISLCWPNGSRTGCVAFAVPVTEIVTTEVSILSEETRFDDDNDDEPLERLIVDAVNLARGVLASTETRFTRYVDDARAILSIVENATNGNGNDKGQRRRRRSLTESADFWIDQLERGVASFEKQLTSLPLVPIDATKLLANLAVSLPSVVAHPIEFASTLANNTQSLTLNAAQSVVQTGVDLAWQYLTTQGLPLLHKTLNNLDATNVLPSGFHVFVQNFNAFYDLAKLFGYIK